MQILYKPSFLHTLAKLPVPLQEEAKEKIELFQKDPRHPYLKTHKLKGELRGRFSFSVNYEYRVVFRYESKTAVVLLAIGDHDVYQ